VYSGITCPKAPPNLDRDSSAVRAMVARGWRQIPRRAHPFCTEPMSSWTGRARNQPSSS
jgi:hypothetical protein